MVPSLAPAARRSFRRRAAAAIILLCLLLVLLGWSARGALAGLGRHECLTVPVRFVHEATNFDPVSEVRDLQRQGYRVVSNAPGPAAGAETSRLLTLCR
jgi:hypothetical protein